LAIQRRLVEAVEVTENRVHVIRLKGIFDASTVSEFEKVVSYLLARNFYKVIVDLGHVEFISSAGWGTFTAELRRVRENQGDVKLANMSPDVCDVFLLLELDSFIQSFDTVDESLAAFLQPAVAPEPGPARPSILQEIKAASHAREMAEAGARAVAEKPVLDFSERWGERTFAGQETYATAFAAPANEKAVFAGATRNNERAYERSARSFDSIALLKEAEGAVDAPRDQDETSGRSEYPVEQSAPRDEREATAPSDGEDFGGQSEYAIAGGVAEAEYYDDSSHSLHGQYGKAEQTEYAGDDYAGEAERASFSFEAHDDGGAAGQTEYAGNDDTGEGEYENYSVEPENESVTAEQAEYAGDVYTDETEYEDSAAESYSEEGAAEQAEYAGEVYADETEYEGSSAESYTEDGVTEQAEYAGDVYADETEYGDSSAESYGEDGAAEQAEYAGDVYADETEYEDSAAESYDEDGAAEQAEYAGEVYVDESEYENSSAEPYSEDGLTEQAEYAGDVYAEESEYEDSSAESYSEGGVARQGEYAGDVYADEAEYEDSAAEPYGEDGVTEQADYAGDVYADEAEYEDSAAESYGDDGVVRQAEYAGDGYASEDEYESSPAESDDEYGAIEQAGGVIETRNDFAIAEDAGESGSDRSTPPAPAASGPEMWELIFGDGQAPVDPYMVKKSARIFSEEEKPQEFFASGATKPLSGRPNAADLLPGSASEISAPDMSSDVDDAFEEFVELGAAPDLGFAGHEPFVDDISRTDAHAAAASAETDFEHAPVKSSTDDNEFDEFETQDIRDPWILEEIDTLPEEDEMEGGAADGEESSFSASELLSYDLELDAPFSPLSEQAHERNEFEAAGESPTRFAASSQAGGDGSLDNFRGSLTHDAEGDAQVEPGFARPGEMHAILAPDDLQGDFSAPPLADENWAMSGDESLGDGAFDPPAKSKKKRTARTKKNKPKTKRANPDRSAEAEASIAPLPSLSSHDGNDEASHDYPPDGALPKIPASDNLEEIVRAVIATHPEFGAAMICKFIEDRFEPPVVISRSTVYRFLREADLNTREKRQEYADQLFDPSVLAEAI
jgi:anti-anti-sigma factor